MKATDYYQLKAIVLGLRDGYLSGQPFIRLAKSCLQYDEDKIRDISFYINSFDGQDSLFIEFLTYPEVFDDIKKLLTLFSNDSKDSKRVFYVMPNLPIDEIQVTNRRCKAKIIDNDQFQKAIHQYFDLPFFRNIQNEFSSAQSHDTLMTEMAGFSFYSDVLTLSYIPNEDIFFADAGENSILQGLNETFDDLFFSFQFSLAMQEMISPYCEENINVRISPELAEFTRGEVGEEGGLVENEDGSHDFVGDETSAVSNYIQLPGDTYLWRILSIDSDGNLKIIRNRDESLTSIYTTADSSNWAGTTVLANLNSFYQEHLANLSDIIVQNPNWLLTSASNSNPTAVTINGSYTDSPIGLIRNDEVVNSSGSVSNNEDCASWLNDGYQWTMTSVTNKPKQAFRMNEGKFRNSNINTNTVYRPVIYLKSTVSFSGGTGTEGAPFVVS